MNPLDLAARRNGDVVVRDDPDVKVGTLYQRLPRQWFAETPDSQSRWSATRWDGLEWLAAKYNARQARLDASPKEG